IDGSPCDTLGIDNLVAVEEVERAEQAELAVYPNPAGESFTVEYGREPHLGQRVVITDITGRPMFNQSFQGKNTEINTSAFPPGLYLVCLLEEGRTIARAKLLVNR
ncbi:MAG: T9SS type A sorting domain-containing protein, partial [Phaeodactylibacter sp.]|nr:T9SS type A sorting domain-containing protein [Phaeodactylibacter sp.]